MTVFYSNTRMIDEDISGLNFVKEVSYEEDLLMYKLNVHELQTENKLH